MKKEKEKVKKETVKQYCAVCDQYYYAENQWKHCPKCDHYGYSDKCFGKLSYYLDTHRPDEKLGFANGFYNQIDQIRRVCAFFGKDKEERDVVVKYTHFSKSVELPVPIISYKGYQIMMRNNFHNTVVTVKAPKSIEKKWIKKLISMDETPGSLYCEGFPHEWSSRPCFNEDPRFFNGYIGGWDGLKVLAFVLGNLADGMWS